jgi:hypothetical protein
VSRKEVTAEARANVRPSGFPQLQGAIPKWQAAKAAIARIASKTHGARFVM